MGQAHVVQTLRNAIVFGRVSHAYLFSGARGIGKTSVARIFAKAVRCPNAKGAIPCNECAECVAINDSRSVDVVEIDGASNNGVEAVRGIRENVAYSASSGFYKVYIIDEVHMLSLSAFNALLKTLEEPPKHVIFIFATTEVQKIPLTVLGRCQRFEFRRLTQSEIVERLEHILGEEKVRIEKAGLQLIASHSDGSLRDALSLLDQVLSYATRTESGGEALTEKQVVAALGVSETSAVTDFLKLVVRKDVKGLIGLIGDNYLAGVDLKHFAERCLEELRLLYLAVLARESKDVLTAESLDISATRFQALETIAKEASLLQLERMAQILSKAIREISWSSLPRFVLEMAAVRMSKLDTLAEIEAALIKAGSSGSNIELVAPASSTAPAIPPEKTRPSEGPAARTAPPPPPPPYPEEEESGDFRELAPPRAPERMGPEARWESFVETVRKRKPLLGSILRHANYKIESGSNGVESVTMSFSDGNADLASERRRDIEEQVKSFFGKDTLFAFSSGKGGTINSIETTKQAEATALKKKTLEDPNVVKLKEALGAEVVDVNVNVEG